MRRIKVAPAALAAALALGAGLSPAFALALRSAAASVAVNGLSPGTPCRLSDCAATKLSLLNTGAEPASVALTVAEPDGADLQDGYEPAASAAWVKLDASGWSLAPGRSGETDGVVSVPAGAARPGQYQLNWLAEGVSPSGLRLRLRSRLLLRVGDGDEDQWRRERRRAQKRPDAEVALLASRGPGRSAALGRGAALRDLGAAVKAANASGRAQTVRVSVRAPSREDVPQGYEPCPNAGFMKAPRRVQVAAGKVVELPLSLDVPDEPRYRGRKWAFEVDVQALESVEDEPERAVVVVETEGAASR